MFVYHRQPCPFRIKPRNARSQTLLGLHHGEHNQRFHVLYAGVTGNLRRRVWEHKNKIIPGFTCQYNLTRLVYYKAFCSPDNAIDREKEIKGWRRNKKIRLIEAINPHWYDLAAEWGHAYNPDNGVTPRKVPRLADENARHRDDKLEG